jgi:hypothetical protein
MALEWGLRDVLGSKTLRDIIVQIQEERSARSASAPLILILHLAEGPSRRRITEKMQLCL